MKKIVLLLTTFALFCSCNKGVQDEQDSLATKALENFSAFLVGTWKLESADIPHSTKNDYTSDNVVFVFKSDGTLTILGEISYDVDVPEYETPLAYENYIKDKHKLTHGDHTCSLLEPISGNLPAIKIGDATYTVYAEEDPETLLSGNEMTLMYFHFFYSFRKVE